MGTARENKLLWKKKGTQKASQLYRAASPGVSGHLTLSKGKMRCSLCYRSLEPFFQCLQIKYLPFRECKRRGMLLLSPPSEGNRPAQGNTGSALTALLGSLSSHHRRGGFHFAIFLK